MLVIDVLEVISATYVYLVDKNDQLVACYNGKDSIPEKYNTANVTAIEPLNEKSVCIMADIA